MSKSIPHCLAFACTASLLIAGSSADASARDRILSVQGSHGHGYTTGRSVSRNPDVTQVRRNLQTHADRGVTTTRDATYDNGAASNTVSRTYNNGATATRSGSVSVGKGAISSQRTHTGAAGNTQSAWDTIYRTDEGYSRTRGIETSRGHSVTAEPEVSITDGRVVVDTQVTTVSGATVSLTGTVEGGQ